MPRVTRKQKEARGIPSSSSGKPHISNPRPLVKGKPRSHNQSQSTGGGFKVIPSRAPRDAYLGKARKLKADLIERAKIKRQFAKVLKEEGLESTRLGDGFRRRGDRDDQGDVEDDEAAKDEEGGGGGDDGASDSDESSVEGMGERSISSGRGRTDKVTGTSKGKGRGKIIESPRQKPSGSGFIRGPKGLKSPNSSKPFKSSRQPAVPAPAPAPTPAEPLPSLRSLKKEAFGKFNPSRHSFTSSSTNTSKGSGAGAGGSGSGGGGASRGGFRGQPKLGARMDVLLERIKRGKA